MVCVRAVAERERNTALVWGVCSRGLALRRRVEKTR